MKTEHIIIIIVGVVVAYLVYSSYGRPRQEYFSPYASSQELDRFYEGSTDGIKDYLVDTMTCSKDCCGDSNMPTFDGLTSDEIYQAYSTIGPTNGPYVRTNHTCGNGIGGVGCPCINKKAYKFITNHGHNSKSIQEIEPTFLLGSNLHQTDNVNEMTPYEIFQAQRSPFVNNPRLNDLELQRTPNPVDNVRMVGRTHRL